MKKIALIMAVVGVFFIGNAAAQEFTLQSDDMAGQLTEKQVFLGFGCNGKNISPSLKWVNAPQYTKSFAVTVYDPDAPTGSGWWHWVIFNIPANVNELKSDAGDLSKNIAPEGSVQSMTDFGKPGYGGPCPPPGAPHEYLITVYALKGKIDLDKTANPAMVGFYLNQNMIEKASIVMYAKQ